MTSIDQRAVDVAHQLGDGKRRGIGGEYGLGLADLIKLFEDFDLRVHILQCGLYDQVSISRDIKTAEGDSAKDLIDLFLGHFALLHQTGEALRKFCLLAFRILAGNDAHQDFVAVSREDLCDAHTHKTGSNDCNFHSFVPLSHNQTVLSFISVSPGSAYVRKGKNVKKITID